MIAILIALLVSVLVCSMWIQIPVKKASIENRPAKKDLFISCLIGFTLCSLCIMIPQLIWDRFVPIDSNVQKNIFEAFILAFFRAAMIEELIKMLFVKKRFSKLQVKNKISYMTVAGCIGMGYGLLEKIMYGGSMGIMLLNAVIAGHIMFQFVMGSYLYDAKVLSEQGDEENAKKKRLLAYFVPVAIHGIWDFILMSMEVFEAYGEPWETISIFVVLIAVIAALVLEIKLVKKMCKIAKEL